MDDVVNHRGPEHLVPEHLVPEHLVPEHLVPEHLVPEHLVSEHLVPEHLVSEHLVSEHLVSEHLVSEHAAPSREGQVARENDRGVLVVRGEKLEEQVGWVQLDARDVELLLQILTEREERSLVATASHLTFSARGKVITASRLVAAIIDQIPIRAPSLV